MAGELWRSAWQLGKEVTPGTAVAATRIAYFNADDSSLKGPDAPATAHRFAVGRRDNQLAWTRGPVQPGGTVKLPVSADECLELYAMGIQASAAPVTGVFTFKPGNTSPDAGTVRWSDGANAWIMAGTYASQLKWEGNVEKGNDLTATLLGMSHVAGSLTGSLTDRTPSFVEGWETRLFIDDLGDTPGTTQIAGTLINWSITFDNKIERKYFANNTKNLGALSIQEIDLKAQLTFEASSATALTEFTNAQSETARLIRVQFGQDGTSTTLDLPGVWTAEDLGQKDKGTRVYRLDLGYVYDVTNAFGLQVKCESARSAVWAAS